MRLIHVVGRAGTAHLGRHPSGFQRVREDVRPAPSNGEGQHRIVKLALRVSRRTVPAALLPENVVEIGVGMMVHTGDSDRRAAWAARSARSGYRPTAC